MILIPTKDGAVNHIHRPEPEEIYDQELLGLSANTNSDEGSNTSILTKPCVGCLINSPARERSDRHRHVDKGFFGDSPYPRPAISQIPGVFQ